MRFAFNEPTWEKLRQCDNMYKRKVVAQTLTQGAIPQELLELIFVALATPVSLQKQFHRNFWQ